MAATLVCVKRHHEEPGRNPNPFMPWHSTNSSLFLFGAMRSWHALAQGSRQRNLVVLFVNQDLANLFAHSIFTQLLALADSFAIVSNGFRLVFEIELQHLFGFFRRPDDLGFNRWHTAEIVNLFSDDQCVVQFLCGVLFKFACDVHELRALQYLGIDDVSDDRLVFARQVLIQ